MQILIIKDAATKIPREVASMDDVKALEAQGFCVEVVDHPVVEEPPELRPAAKKAKKA